MEMPQRSPKRKRSSTRLLAYPAEVNIDPTSLILMKRPGGLDKEQESKQWRWLGWRLGRMVSWEIWEVSNAGLLETARVEKSEKPGKAREWRTKVGEGDSSLRKGSINTH